MPKMPKIIEEKIQEETPYHENTKVRKHEKGKGVYETLFFRAFVLSCFRGGFAFKLLCLDSTFAFWLRDDS